MLWQLAERCVKLVVFHKRLKIMGWKTCKCCMKLCMSTLRCAAMPSASFNQIVTEPRQGKAWNGHGTGWLV